MEKEPLITVASITAGITAILGLLVAFGVSLTGDQEKAILGVAAVAAPLLVALFARPKVTPVATPPALNERGYGSLVLILAVVGIVLIVLLLVGSLNIR